MDNPDYDPAQAIKAMRSFKRILPLYLGLGILVMVPVTHFFIAPAITDNFLITIIIDIVFTISNVVGAFFLIMTIGRNEQALVAKYENQL